MQAAIGATLQGSQTSSPVSSQSGEHLTHASSSSAASNAASQGAAPGSIAAGVAARSTSAGRSVAASIRSLLDSTTELEPVALAGSCRTTRDSLWTASSAGGVRAGAPCLLECESRERVGCVSLAPPVTCMCGSSEVISAACSAHFLTWRSTLAQELASP
jgi:hypothetical protein